MNGISTNPSNGFTDNLPESADELQTVLRAERKELKRSLDELGSAVRDKVDVRSRLLEHPLMSVGAALAAGLILGVLSNRAVASSAPSSAPPGAAVKLAGKKRKAKSNTFGQMASTVAALVGQRLANVAEDAVRSALTREPSNRSS